MEFDEMKKIWDEQNQEALYAINEAALHRSIRSKKKRANRLSNINDIGLTIIALLTAVTYISLEIIWEQPSIYDYMVPVILVGIAVYVWSGRIRRKQEEGRFERSMLGDLDHAIANVQYEARRAQTMVWWFLLPLAIPTFLNMLQGDIQWWKMLSVAAGFLLAYSLIRWELKRCHLPRIKRLKSLRQKLTVE